MINLTIPSKPMAKGRPLFARRGKFVSTRTPEKTVLYENMVKALFWQQYGTDYAPMQGALIVSIHARFLRPRSHYGTGRNSAQLKAAAPRYMVSKPDLDNMAKIILDALNGIAFGDDSHVTELVVSKAYGDVEGCEVSIVNVTTEGVE